jgi:hypothetical protein
MSARPTVKYVFTLCSCFSLRIRNQITPIKGSHAHVLFALTDISPGDPITVSYTKEGYHDASQPCLCSTCQPHNPPGPPERRPPLPEILLPLPGKKKYRGGKRVRVRRENREKRLNAQEGCSVSGQSADGSGV